MDPFTALGLASNIVQFVDFSSKLISGVYEVYSSNTGTTAENAHLSTVIEDLQAVTRRLSPLSSRPMTDDEKSLYDLVVKCRKLSGDLLKVLGKLKSKNSHSTWESVRVAWSSMRKKGQLTSMERRVNDYRSEILLRINIMISEEQSLVRVQLEKIEQQNEKCATRTRDDLKRLEKGILGAVEKLRQDCPRNNPQTSSEQPRETLEDVRVALSKMVTVTTSIAKEDNILKKLRFDSMYSREDSIEDAHAETFKWLLDDPINHPNSVVDLDSDDDRGSDDDLEQESDSEQVLQPEQEHGFELRRNTRATFLEWLRLGSGIFYISGKAGSGKSTLMKFLCQHRRTRDELKLWAGDKKLVLAYFFFWNSGTDLQKSLEGLYRSIIFETLRECPELIRVLFPEHWRMASSAIELGSEDMSFRFPEILTAFDILTKSNQSFPAHKFCFFIDGLDEYAGDHWKMAESLKTWTVCRDIKICVSSRPYNEFENSFSPDPQLRLRLHELTEKDVEQFVRDELEGDERFIRVKDKDERYLKLVDKIVEAADGVFLWVRLVTKSLLQGLGNDYLISELEEKLRTLPTGLDNLFRKIWDSIEEFDRVRAARMFLITTPLFGDANFLTYSFLDDLEENPHFADEMYDGTVRAFTKIELLERLTRTKTRLNGRCKGLLEITGQSRPDPFFRYHVSFLHRTVRDFLDQEEMQRDLKFYAGNFNTDEFHCLASLAKIKFIPTKENYFRYKRGQFLISVYNICHNIVEFALQAAEERPYSQIRILEALEDMLDRHREVPFSDPDETAENSGRIYWVEYHEPGYTMWRGFEASGTDYSLLHYAAHRGAFAFVSQRVSESSSLLKPSCGRSLLVSASLGLCWRGGLTEIEWKMPRPLQCLKLTKYLLESGASPNEQIPGWQYYRAGERIVAPIVSGSLVWTLWTVFILGSTKFVNRSSRLKWIPELFELFLRNDADVEVCLLGYQVKIFKEYETAKEEMIILGGPFYMTLDQIIEVWDPGNTELIRYIQQKCRKVSRNWSSWMGSTMPLWKKQQPRTPKIQIKRFKFDEVQDPLFAVTSVVTMASLDKLSNSEIHFVATIKEDLENGGASKLVSTGISVRIA